MWVQDIVTDDRPELILRRGRRAKGTFAPQGEDLRGTRMVCGLTQRRMAEFLSRELSTYRDWEDGRAKVPRLVRERVLGLATWKRTGVRPWWADPFGESGAE